MYDTFSEDYDRFVNWPSRLAYEMPFIEKELATLGSAPLRILDAACATGMHAIFLAQRGHAVSGADLSQSMIERARQNAGRAGADVNFDAVGFGSLSHHFQPGSFDALLCLGNSLPHLTSEAELAAALQDFARLLRPEGLLMVQNRNFDLVMADRERWMEPQYHQEDNKEWLFLRFYDYEPDGLINFNVVTLYREDQSPWKQQVSSTPLRPILHTELVQALGAAGFYKVACYGDMAGSTYKPLSSGNLIVVSSRA
jgi:SAM-dependent methyltransferase